MCMRVTPLLLSLALLGCASPSPAPAEPHRAAQKVAPSDVTAAQEQQPQPSAPASAHAAPSAQRQRSPARKPVVRCSAEEPDGLFMCAGPIVDDLAVSRISAKPQSATMWLSAPIDEHSVPSLARIPEVERVHIIGRKVDLTMLPVLNQLQALTIRSDPLPSLGTLPQQPKLRRLEVVLAPQAVGPLGTMTSLKELTLHCQVEDLNWLANLKSLQRLELSFAPDDWSAIAKLPKLEWLRVRRTSAKRITPVLRARGLRHLDVPRSLDSAHVAQIRRAHPRLAAADARRNKRLQRKDCKTISNWHKEYVICPEEKKNEMR